ncbi:MAG: hypothetical protein ACK6D5_24280, partial [Planctomyces sp.]
PPHSRRQTPGRPGNARKTPLRNRATAARSLEKCGHPGMESTVISPRLMSVAILSFGVMATVRR